MPINPARAIKGSSGYHTHSPFLIINVHTDAGIIGLGEVSCTPFWSGEDHFTAQRFIQTILEPVLVGQDPTEVERLTALVNSVLPDNVFTRSGIEMALWDILAKAAGLPLYRLLGGKVRENVATKFSISGLEPERAAEIARWAYDQGFRTMKVKVGMEIQSDVDRVRAVREAVGPDVRLGVDANGGWSVTDAVRAIDRMTESDIYFAEQPVAAGDLNGMAEVRSRTDVPIMADESVYSPRDAINLVQAGAADIFSLYVGKGGIGLARKIAAIAEGAGIACTIGSNLELGIGSAAMMHLAISTSAVQADRYPCDILTPFYYEHSLLKDPVDISAGRAVPPEAPGLGIELDEEAVEKYRVSTNAD